MKDMELLKDIMGVTQDVDTEIIEIYRSWAEEEAFDLPGIPEEHQEHFKDEKQYERLVVLLTTLYYEVRVPFGQLSEGEMPYGIRRCIRSLNKKYIRWLSENGD